MKLSKGTVINVYNIRVSEGNDMEVPELIQITIGEVICNSTTDSDASDYEGDEVELEVVMRELGEYMYTNHSYALAYDWDWD